MTMTHARCMQAIGIMPNAASAEALLQSCQDCTHLFHKVNSMTAPFQAVLATAQFRPTVDPLHSASTSAAAQSAQSLPSVDIMYRWQTGSDSNPNMAPATLQMHPSSGAGLLTSAPSPGHLTGALSLGPYAAKQSLDQSWHLPAAPKAEPLAARPGSGPPTGAPPTPDLQSEVSDTSPLHDDAEPAHRQ